MAQNGAVLIIDVSRKDTDSCAPASQDKKASFDR
jgi:hypothetical protein